MAQHMGWQNRSRSYQVFLAVVGRLATDLRQE